MLRSDRNLKASVWFVSTTMGLVFILLVLFVWLIFVDGTYVRKPVTYWAGSFNVLGCPCKPGGDVRVTLFATKNTDGVATIYWTLVNNRTGQTWSYAPRYGALLKGYRAIESPPLTLPLDVPPGSYHLSGTALYDVSVFKTVSYPMRSTDFEIGAEKRD